MSNTALFSLADQVAIVTGAAGLLGQAHCKALAQAGAHIIALDLDEARVKQVTAELPGPGRHLAIGADLRRKSELEPIRDHLLEQFGKISILVNNAAMNDRFEDPALAAAQSRFEAYPVDMFRASLEANVTSIFLAAQVFGTPMSVAGKGSIINIASTYGIVGPDQTIYQNSAGQQTFYKSAAYPTTKGAVLNFTRFLAAYWGAHGVRVNSLSPGGVENGQEDWFVQNYAAKTLLGRMAQPQDYQGALVFLASDASAYMTGANLIVDGGWTAI